MAIMPRNGSADSGVRISLRHGVHVCLLYVCAMLIFFPSACVREHVMVGKSGHIVPVGMPSVCVRQCVWLCVRLR